MFSVFIIRNKINAANIVYDLLKKELINVDVIVVDNNDNTEVKMDKIVNNKIISFNINVRYNSQIIIRMLLKDEKHPLDIILSNKKEQRPNICIMLFSYLREMFK
jgi:hypothetical protein